MTIPLRSLLTIASSEESTIAASRSASRSMRPLRSMWRATIETPMLSPSGASIGDTESRMSIRSPFLRWRAVTYEIDTRPSRTWRMTSSSTAGPGGMMMPIERPTSFLRRVTEHAFGRAVPEFDGAIQAGADDGVFEGFDEGCEPERRGVDSHGRGEDIRSEHQPGATMRACVTQATSARRSSGTRKRCRSGRRWGSTRRQRRFV